MNDTAAMSSVSERSVSLDGVEAELGRLRLELKSGAHGPIMHARMSNLVVFCSKREQADLASSILPDILALHPARTILAVAESERANGISASVSVRANSAPDQQPFCTEQITLHASAKLLETIPYAVRELLIGDLPTNLWWADSNPPSLAGPIMYELAESAQQIIYDSLGLTDPHRGIAATASWLVKLEMDRAGITWRVASDLNWRRLKYWRRLLSQTLDPASFPGVLETIREVAVEHGPHGVTQAWELVGWIASCLNWRVRTGHIDDGVEISWAAEAAHGPLTVRMHRLSKGPNEVTGVQINHCRGGIASLTKMQRIDDLHLAAMVEGAGTELRTVTARPQSVAEMIGRQLSDREPDPLFRRSMTVAQVFAKSVLS
jgi:glucose-6-phosphate dehydrogenase assembly protein OpcA